MAALRDVYLKISYMGGNKPDNNLLSVSATLRNFIRNI